MFKKHKNVFTLEFSLYAFPKIYEMLETHPHKKIDFQHYRETTQCRNLQYFSQTAKLKCRET